MKIKCDNLGYAHIRKKIPIKEIVWKEKYPEKLMIRAEKYVEQIKKGKKFPPIMVFGKRWKNDTYQVFDGHARLEAHKMIGKSKIDAEITLVDKKGSSIKCSELRDKRRTT